MRRSPLRSLSKKRLAKLHEPTVTRESKPMALHPSTRAHSYSGGLGGAVVKPQAGRNPALLAMAKGRRCLLLAVWNCEGHQAWSSVACHQNEGKGMAIKASDERSVWGCAACHEWLDRSGSPRAEKRRAFDAAHIRQIEEWRKVSADASEPERFRRAAQWALDRMKEAA